MLSAALTGTAAYLCSKNEMACEAALPAQKRDVRLKCLRCGDSRVL